MTMRKIGTSVLIALFAGLLCLPILASWGFAEEADPTATGEGNANSWRFRDGELLDGNLVTEFDSDADASVEELATSEDFEPWTWNGTGFISSNGTVIPNAIAKGIDVSEWNYTIDWDALKASDVDFVIIRCGYGQDYESQDDDYWLRNIRECRRVGMPFGVYLYSYADSVKKASSEADHVLRCLREAGVTTMAYPVYYDLEETSIGSVENRDLLAKMTHEFCSKIAANGFRAGVYSSTSWWNNYLTDPEFDNWDRWVAQWNSRCTYDGYYSIWQCADDGRVPGIETRVDVNFQIKQLPSDVSATDWFVRSGVYKFVTSNGYMKGYGQNDLFGPWDYTTRAQIAIILWRVADEPKASSVPFKDVNYDLYYGEAIKWARSADVIQGYGASSENDKTSPDIAFGPDDYVTREQFAQILYNYASRLSGLDMSYSMKALQGMADASQVDSWAAKGMAWACDKGIILGSEKNGVKNACPRDNATRAELAAMLMRFTEFAHL